MLIGNLEVYGIIYKVTNTANKKVYIGQTVCGIKSRYPHGGITLVERMYKNHKYLKNHGYAYNKHLLVSIEKYGVKSFEGVELFDYAFSKNELDIKESMYIKLYKSINRKHGYNNKEGGGNGKLSETITDSWGKSLIQLSLDGNKLKVWETVAKARRNLKLTNIRFSNKENISNSYGFIWIFEEDYDKNYNYKYTRSIYDNCVILDEKGNFIKEYFLATDVLKEFGISMGYYQGCVRGMYLLKSEYNLVRKDLYKIGEYTLLTSRKGKYIGKNNYNYGIKRTSEQKLKLREAHKYIQKGENHPMYGKHHTDEAKEKNREWHKGKGVGENNGFATTYEIYDIDWKLIKVIHSSIKTIEWLVSKGYIGSYKSGKTTLSRIFNKSLIPYKGLYFKRYKKTNKHEFDIKGVV